MFAGYLHRQIACFTNILPPVLWKKTFQHVPSDRLDIAVQAKCKAKQNKHSQTTHPSLLFSYGLILIQECAPIMPSSHLITYANDAISFVSH